MKAVNLYGPDDLRIDDIEHPQPGPKDAVIKLVACGICGSDLTFKKMGSMRENGPMPLGHEAAGIVTEVGARVRGLDLGARVAINPMGEMSNVIGNGGTEGAFADYLLVRNAELGRNLVEVPEGLPLEIAAIAEPLGVALHAVNRSGLVAGEKVVVFGVGPIGLGAVIWLKRRGAADIVAVDLSPERLAVAEKFGADRTVRADKEDLERVLADLHGREDVMGMPCVGTDVYIDAAGAAPIVPQVIALAKKHARLVVPAVYQDAVPIHFGQMLMKEFSITTSIGYPDEFPSVVEMLADEPQAFDAYISHRFDFSEFSEAMQVASERSASKVMIRFAEN
jgi:(R,R)-butanediol dehydrogenase / meso-butanediol dehydrogenase / diacetyl reductase